MDRPATYIRPPKPRQPKRYDSDLPAGDPGQPTGIRPRSSLAALPLAAPAPEQHRADREREQHRRRATAAGVAAAAALVVTTAAAGVGRGADPGVDRAGHRELLADRRPLGQLAGVVLD